MNDLLAKLAEAAESPVSLVDLAEEKERIIIDMDSRSIKIIDMDTQAVKGTSNFGIRYDHLAKTKVIETDRYVGDVDLAEKSCAIHWVNGKNAGVMPVTEIDLSLEGKILIKWSITNQYTQYSGNVAFAVHFFSIVDGAFTYHVASGIAYGKLGETLNASDHSTPPLTPSDLEVITQLINELASQKLNSSGHTPNMYLGTDAEGNVVTRAAPSGGGGGTAYIIGEGLKLDEATQTLSVDTAAEVQQDNTRPITSAAVYTTVGNIEALLKTI